MGIKGSLRGLALGMYDSVNGYYRNLPWRYNQRIREVGLGEKIVEFLDRKTQIEELYRLEDMLDSMMLAQGDERNDLHHKFSELVLEDFKKSGARRKILDARGVRTEIINEYEHSIVEMMTQAGRLAERKIYKK